MAGHLYIRGKCVSITPDQPGTYRPLLSQGLRPSKCDVPRTLLRDSLSEVAVCLRRALLITASPSYCHDYTIVPLYCRRVGFAQYCFRVKDASRTLDVGSGPMVATIPAAICGERTAKALVIAMQAIRLTTSMSCWSALPFWSVCGVGWSPACCFRIRIPGLLQNSHIFPVTVLRAGSGALRRSFTYAGISGWLTGCLHIIYLRRIVVVVSHRLWFFPGHPPPVSCSATLMYISRADVAASRGLVKGGLV